MTKQSNQYWVVVPAAGVGRRLGAAIPKQYLPLLGRTVLEWAIDPFLHEKKFASLRLAGIVVAISPEDERFGALPLANDRNIRTVPGGNERADSVLNALESLHAADDDWVLVHDAARPCLAHDDLGNLVAAVQDDEVGGLLACALTDTLKRSDDTSRVYETVPRAHLWRALTPQMFRVAVLRDALRSAKREGRIVTDESSAVEAMGMKPKLVAGRSDNIKITLPEDMMQAELILRARSR